MSDGARWRRVYSNEWHASAFQGLDDAERVVYFYCRTGPQSTSVGIYRISSAVAVEDIGNLTAVEFDFRLDTVCQALDWRFDSSTRVLWIPTWLRENPPQSPNVCVSWRKLLANLPDCDLKFEAAEAVAQSLKELPKAFREAFGSLPKDFRISKAKPLSKPESNQGAGDSGIQGSGRKGTGGGLERKPHNGAGGQRAPIGHLVTVAREAINLAGPNQPLDTLVDAFLEIDRRQGGRSSKQQAYEAINAALSERRATA